MSQIFISYRRSDSEDIVGRLFDRLSTRFGKVNIFKDVHSIPFGTDFRRSISDALATCHVVLAVIGPNWISAANQKGKPRLFDPNDYVRIEIEAALARNILVIPVLIGGARLPGYSQLPPTLRKIQYRHAAHLRSDPFFSTDVKKLISSISRYLIENNPNFKDPQSIRNKTIEEIIYEYKRLERASNLEKAMHRKRLFVFYSLFSAGLFWLIPTVIAMFLGIKSPFSGLLGKLFGVFMILFLLGFVFLTIKFLNLISNRKNRNLDMAKLERKYFEVLDQQNPPESDVANLLSVIRGATKTTNCS